MDSTNSNPALANIESADHRSFAYPLDGLYSYYQYPLPTFTKVEPDDIPDPYQGLLVHKNDMTPTLEAFHGEKIWIRPEARYLENSFYFREVILFLENSLKPVEYGAIVIHLENCNEDARQSILEARKPLGTLMKEFSIPHQSEPIGFFKVESDSLISRRLQIPEGETIYGRRNELITPEGLCLAEIVEILPSHVTVPHEPLV